MRTVHFAYTTLKLAKMKREDKATVIDAKLFPFITWESGRFWSIKELLDLEVEE